MGSLMAGWDAPLTDPKSVGLEGERSLTRMEIESYWRSHQMPEEEQQRREANMDYLANHPKEARSGECTGFGKVGLQESDSNVQPAMTKQTNISDWWTRSNWAFLNEAVSEEADDDTATHKLGSSLHDKRPHNSASHKYESQFHVSQLTTAK